MTVVLSFLAAVLLTAGWWLSRQRLASRPWLETGVAPAGSEPRRMGPDRLGLGVFVAVVGGLFAMLGSAFVMQVEETPWQLVPLPGLVWANTAVLALASVLLQAGAWAARARAGRKLNACLAAATIATLAFLAGQGQAWGMLTADGYALDGAPTASFFYLITGLHGLHILGGLTALSMVWLGRGTDVAPDRMQRGIELCALYWHALLAIWLVLIVLLAGWGNAFLALCRTAIT